jgi:hypothetical protein
VDLIQPDAGAADPVPDPALFVADGSILLKGVVSLKPGTPLLIVEKNWNGSDCNYALVTVSGTEQEKDPGGSPNTRVRVSVRKSGIPDGAHAVDYEAYRSTQTAHVWQYPATTIGTVIGANSSHMDSLLRNIRPGQMVLFEVHQTSLVLQPLIASSSSLSLRGARRRCRSRQKSGRAPPTGSNR